jgi:hypothetical protein
MGSLALAAYGAGAGLGQGMTEVGQLEQKKQLMAKENELATNREATIARLRDSFEKENISNQQQFALKGAAAGREFELGQTKQKQEFESSQQKAKLASSEGVAARHEAGATARTERTAASRENVAKTRAAGTQKETPTWSSGHYQVAGPTPESPPTTIPLRIHRDGRVFVQSGDKFMLYDASQGGQLPDVKGVRTAPTAATQDLVNNPMGTNKTTGETNADAFQRAYGYLPSQYFSAIDRAQHPTGAPAGPLGKNAPPNSTWVQTSGGPASNAQDAADDAKADAEDHDTEQEEADPYGRNGPPTSSPEDTQPAQ